MAVSKRPASSTVTKRQPIPEPVIEQEEEADALQDLYVGPDQEPIHDLPTGVHEVEVNGNYPLSDELEPLRDLVDGGVTLTGKLTECIVVQGRTHFVAFEASVVTREGEPLPYASNRLAVLLEYGKDELKHAFIDSLTQRTTREH